MRCVRPPPNASGLEAEAHPRSLDVVRRSLDVRRQRPRYSYSVDVGLPPRAAKRLQSRKAVAQASAHRKPACAGFAKAPAAGIRRRWSSGPGPQALLAALTFAKAGLAAHRVRARRGRATAGPLGEPAVRARRAQPRIERVLSARAAPAPFPTASSTPAWATPASMP